MFERKFFIHFVTEFLKLFGELLRVHISPARIRNLLTADKKIVSGILGASLGSITPFCSCSTIPVLTGLIKSGAPFCGVVSFLLTSPILNPAIITLFLAFFGLKAAAIYATFVLVLAVIIGLLLDKFGFVKEVKLTQAESCGCQAVLPYLLIGASIGAFIHEVIPTDFPENFAGKNQLSSRFKRKMIATFVTCVFTVALVT